MMRLTRAQLREIDRRAVVDYGMPSILLMENAARGASDVAEEMIASAGNAPILILAGGGNNGGDGFAIARHLHNRGHEIVIALLIDPVRLKGDARINYDIACKMNLPMLSATPGCVADVRPALIIDALFGTGLESSPRDPFPDLVHAMNRSGVPILSVDLPSGLDADTGHPLGTAVRATCTVTFVAEKTGFTNSIACEYLGIVKVADIGCPRQLIEQIAAS